MDIITVQKKMYHVMGGSVKWEIRLVSGLFSFRWMLLTGREDALRTDLILSRPIYRLSFLFYTAMPFSDVVVVLIDTRSINWTR